MKDIQKPGLRKVTQNGFVLLELLVVCAIAGLVASAVTMAVFQTFNVSTRNTNHMTAVKQVENAIHSLSRDVQMAQTVFPDVNYGFPLNLTWIEWDNTLNQVTYTIGGNELQRSHSVNGLPVGGITVARYVDPNPAMTTCNYTGGILTYKFTVTLSTDSQEIIETRAGEIVSRPNSPH